MAAYDISLSVDGEKFQPAPGNPLEVSISNPAISENLRLQVWHIRDDGTGEQIPDFTVEGESVRFPAESFSAYLVVQVTLTTNITAGDGNTYRVSVTYDQDAEMPENTDLAVRELGDGEKEDYVNQSAEALGTDAENLAFARAFDISLLDPATGNEVQPASGVKVSIALLDTDVSAADELNLLHFGEEVEKVDYTLNGSAVEFETDGFSVYVLVFSVSGSEQGVGTSYIYSLADGDSVALSAILDKLGITDGVSNVEAAGNGLTANAEDNNWVVAAEDGFTDGTLILTTDSGEITIHVTRKIALTVTAADQTKVYGEDDPVLTAVTSGLEDGHSLESVRLTRETGEDAGTYTITARDAVIMSENESVTDRYAIEYITGRFVIEKATATVTAPTVKNDLKYTGEAQELIEAGTSTGGTLMYSLTGNDEDYSSDIPTAINAGDYTVYYKLDGGINYNDTEAESVSVSIAKKQPEVTVIPVDGLSYTGEPRALVTVEANGCTVQYALEEEGEYSAEIPTGTNGGFYNIYYKVENDPNFEDLDVTSVSTTIAKVEPPASDDPNALVTVPTLTYNGKAQELVAPGTITGGGTVKYSRIDSGEYSEAIPAETDAGTYTVWYKIEGDSNYTDTPQYIDTIIMPMPVTLTANSATLNHTGVEQTVSGFTCSIDGLTFYDVSASGSGTDIGIYDVILDGVVVNETLDSTKNYIVTGTSNGLLFIVDSDDENPSLIEKELTEFNGDLATYAITVNPDGLVLTTTGDPLTLKDTFSGNQSINYGTISISGAEGEPVTYDYSGNTGTYTIPDGRPVIITYVTRVKGDAGESVQFSNTAVLGRMEDGIFVGGPTDTVNGNEVISPTGTDISGTGGVYTIDLFVYSQNHMEEGLEGATFRLLDGNLQPILYRAGKKTGQPITFTTGSDGYVTITLSEETDGLTIHKNTAYYLEMITAPYQFKDGNYIYYQKDNTFYSFLITDDPNYTYGGIYAYYNGDVLKVRCYPEAKGINVTKRFSGNYTLTDAQKNAIRFVLQKEALDTESGWTNVESHTYGEFSYGSMNFNTGRSGGTELEDNATYRVIEENALPEELKGIVEENVSVSITYQREGKPIEEQSNEFYIDPDDKLAYSYNLAFTDEYVEHKLTIIKIDEENGKVLKGAVFTVYAVSDETNPIATYTTGEDGAITIRRSDAGANYASDTLYYAVETVSPEHYILPENRMKVYFFFPENNPDPIGLPFGATAIDLTNSYTTTTVSNNSETINVPVTVVWGIKGDETWPDTVDYVVAGLYKSVGGAKAEPVTDGQGNPLTTTLTKDRYYDTTSFKGLPAEENEKTVAYSIVEEGIYTGSENIISQFAYSSSISGTGWYVISNQAAESVKVTKEWYDLDGEKLGDTTDKPEVIFELYRTTKKSEASSFTRAELLEFLDYTDPVRSDLKLSNDNNWSVTVESLEKTDKQENPYYYYALEQIPENQEDSYDVAAASESEPRTLTIKNKQTPITVTIQAKDCEKTYGDVDPVYTFTASIMDKESTVSVSGPDEADDYTATIKDIASGSTVTTLTFKTSRESGKDVGTYVITPAGDALQNGYRVLYETGTLTIVQADVTITAGAEKTYGDDDPAYVTIEGLQYDEKAADVLKFDVSREEGEDVGDYPITLTGDTNQGNYLVTYVRRDDEGNEYQFTINRAKATVKAEDASKIYGENDPEFEGTVSGLRNEDEPSVIAFEMTREAGKDVGTYTITPVGETEQGNYEVSFEPGTLTISAAPITVEVVDSEKTYGDEDPEWIVDIYGLQPGDEEGELSSVLDDTGNRTYTYSIMQDEERVKLLTFITVRDKGENVGTYAVKPSGEKTQGNYILDYEAGDLEVLRAELIVTPKHQVKAVGVVEDPILEADISGWKNGDDKSIADYVKSEDENPTITWTYTRTIGEETVTVLTFTLKRDAGEDEGEYPVAAEGGEAQSNYTVSYEPGTFDILSILDIDVTQPVVDYVDTDANPTYSYTATLDLTGTGLDEYSKNGFEPDEDGVPTLRFVLPETDTQSLKTLKVPAGAKLTVVQETENANYSTAISVDGIPYTNPDDAESYILEHVDTYHEIAFTHSRISLLVEARAAEGQTEEGASVLPGRKGAMGIPAEPRLIDRDFADEMHHKMSYELPTDKYYVYDHASLYTVSGSPVENASNITEIRYFEVSGSEDGTDGGQSAASAEYVWQYKAGEGDYVDVPANTKLVLFYMPKSVCKIGTEKFYSIKAAVDYAVEHGNSATIEMLIGDYAIRSASDAVTIPENCSITITTATTEYEGTGTAIISRSMNYTDGRLFINEGKLTFDNIVLDGNNVSAGAAMVNNAANAELTVGTDAVLENAKGIDGGAIYVAGGTADISGSLVGNSATNGGAIYVAGGEVTVSGTITKNDAANGGAVYVTNGTVTVSGSMSGNSATGNGGAAYMMSGKLEIAEGAMIGGTTEGSGNSAVNGGAVYVTNGTVTVSGSMTGNSATADGGAIYLTAGSCEIAAGGSMSGNSATGNGGAVYQSGGTLTNSGTISGNSATSGGGIYRVNGTLTVNGTISGNSASADGGGVYSNGGTLNLSATVSGNSAVNGGAIYVSSATLNVNGGTIGGTEEGDANTATGNGGAVYALNTATTIDNAAEIGSNTAASLGGALYMEGGSVAVKGESALTENEAANGGAIYATSGSITLGSVTTVKVEETTVTTVTGCSLTENTASGSGGAIYAVSASVNVNVGSVTNNTATTGNGGAICSESGTVTVALSAEAPEGTTLSISGNKAEAGLGGAIYAASGTVNYSGGSITTNSAVNGAAIFVGAGIANISASITGNTSSNGGAVGVGDASARLYFTGDANVNNNLMNDSQSNVYLDVDSELVIHAVTLSSGKKIGVYVPGDVDSDQVVNHGDVTGYFGAYTNDTNVATVFKNDRFGDLTVGYENNRLFWTNALKYDIYYLSSYSTGTQFPPNTASPSKAVVTGQSYVPRTRETDIYDLVMAMKLYEKHESNFKNKVGNQYASLAIYAYTYSNKAMSNTFANYLKKVKWDAEERKWVYTKQDGTPAPANTDKIVIFYSSPAYLTIVNNNASGLTLKLSEINVLGYNAAAGLYGYVTAKNGATISTLRTITDEDLELNAGESIKLMFPGAQSQGITLRGTMSGEGATYTFKGGTEQTVSGTAFELNGTLNANDTAAELLFGSELPICKVGDEPFSTLKDAMAYAVAQKAATDNNTYTIEMLVDYLVPAGDVLEIPAGYDITFTTASRDDETLPYTGNGTRATLSRDTGNSGASVTVKNSILTVINLAFDGRSLTAGGAGGAISADNVATVTITNCEFKGYRADWGGAIFAGNKDSGSPENTKLTIEKCQFSNCQTNANVDKAGGGAVWTTARELYVRNCSFEDCACLQGSAQAGAVFHNIKSGWFNNSITEITDCTFKNCFSAKASGGTIESDAADITVKNCSFDGSYSSKPSGSNGGALNVYAADTASTNLDCILRVINCTFKDCNAKLGSANGGAIRTTTKKLLLQGCKFTNVQSVTGGAVSMTNGNATHLEIYGCTFDKCIATGNGGAVFASVPNVVIGTNADIPAAYGITPSDKFLDNTENDGGNHFIDCNANLGGAIYNAKNNASVSMQNVSFIRCEAKTGSGGALYTQAKTLSITGTSNTFEDCIAQNSGGAIFQNINKATGSSMRLENCVFTGCESKAGDGNGGGMYTNAKTLVISGTGNSFNNCSATNSGGGLFHSFSGDGDTFTIGNCGFDNCIAKAGSGGGLYTNTHSLTITGANSKFKDCTAQTNGGGLYHNQNATGTTFTFQDGNFENCTATGDYGGAIYSPAKTVTLKDATVSDSKAKAQGGGVWFSPTTATISGCTITGNSVSNSDSKGGGVYLGGGTTEYKSGIVSGCSAANGGGWYQTDGTLNILGGVITGNATNGGGIYQAKGTINQYGGAVAGTATANGGGVYKSGTYSLGNGTYNIEYNGGASIGGRITLPVIINGEETTKTVDSLAVNGGGVYNAGGTLTLNAGGSIGSAETNTDGETVYTSTAQNGGGAYIGSGTIAIIGGVITNCKADVNGGGIYYASTSNDGTFYAENENSKIQNCLAANGGGIYMSGSKTFQMGEKNKTSFSTIENCQATVNGGGVYQAGGIINLRNTSIIRDCSADVNGGGVYHMGGTFNIYGSASIDHCKAAANGGGMYNAGGTFTFEGGSITRNVSTENGGGVYHAGGTFSMTSKGTVIGGSEENSNTAGVGAGVFVADGQSATFNDSNYKKLEISYNHALTAGGGIAVGGPAAKLTFTNAVKVQNNTMGTDNTVCNVYLDQDSNTVIQNAYIDPASYIGVYASDAQNEGHGLSGMPFATYSNENNLNSYHNDRLPYLYGVKGSSNNEVVWANFVCKITDSKGNLLYKDENGTPAVYDTLENIIGDGNATAPSGAFTQLNRAEPGLYRKGEDGEFVPYQDEDGEGYQVQMLVQDYELGSKRQIKLSEDVQRKIVLTTASTEADECGFKYTGNANRPSAITRTANTWAMIYAGGHTGWELTLRNITLDGGEKAATEDGAILRVMNAGTVILDKGATLRNAGTASGKSGGAVFIGYENGAEANASFTMKAGSAITDCSAGTSGGGVGLSDGTFNMEGGEITGCSAQNGGAVWIKDRGQFNMRGGAITGNSATAQGGGIFFASNNARACFGKGGDADASGLCTVTGNTLNGSSCNVQFRASDKQSDDTYTAIITAHDLDSRSEIGVYVPDSQGWFQNYGIESKPFGRRVLDDDSFFCFVNDRSPRLRGYRSAAQDNMQMYWEYHPLLRVTKDVVSDWSADRNMEFSFMVQLDLSRKWDGTGYIDDEVRLSTFTFGDMTFNRNGTATIKLKAGQSKTAILPDTLDKHPYTVTEIFVTERPDKTDAQEEDYTTTAIKDGNAYPFSGETRTVAGFLGENIGMNDASTSLSDVVFTNARVTGNLSVSKIVVSTEDTDFSEEFSFKLTLDDTGITKTYDTLKTTLKDGEEGVEIDETIPTESGSLLFTAGEATFTLKHYESLTIIGLPTDIQYTVEEILSDRQEVHVRTQVKVDDGAETYALTATGHIGEKPTVEMKEIEGESVETKVYNSEVTFTNSFLEIVCKIMTRNRSALLYYVDGNNQPQPAIFSHLEEAFEKLNEGKVRQKNNPTIQSSVRIEMVVPEYTMEGPATLNSGKTVILSTALSTDEEFPYSSNLPDDDGVSTVFRGFAEESMIVDRGALTIEKITLDGAYNPDAEIPLTASENGGIVKVDNKVRLTVNAAATLQNSATSGNGGAIYLTEGASLAMNGTIDNCSAVNGGGLYADAKFTTLTVTGTISACKATGDEDRNGGDGGAIYAAAGTSVNLNAGTALVGNTAANNGGAVCSDTNVILRGTIGGSKGNTAANNGGGLWMGSNAMLTMYAGSEISGNAAANGSGGGIATRYTTRIAGGIISQNNAINGNGGAVCAMEPAVVTINGSPEFSGNYAKQGGAIYDQGTVNMTGGSMTGNIATEKGGAIYVADSGEDDSKVGHSFTMSGGSITGGNKSPEGAVSTDENSWLVFSGNAIITGNTDSDGTTIKNVYLGYDSNNVIRVIDNGFGTRADIGVYVADGEPEPEDKEDRADNPIYADHGVGGRNFATYTGDSITTAKLDRFTNDRDTVLKSTKGEHIGTNSCYVIWKGKGLQLKVTQYLIQTDAEGNVILDEDGNPKFSEEIVPVQNASFTFTNVTNVDEENPGVVVWTGKSSAEGLVTIPWNGEEKPNGNAASFVPHSVYRLDQDAADGKTVLPAGHWTVEVFRDNSVEWKVIESSEDNVDRIFDIASPGGSGEKAYLGETFGLKNDVKPTITFDATGGKLKDKKDERTDVISFTTTETQHSYTITETNPTWGSHVFKHWATMQNEPDVEIETEGKTEEDIAAEREEKQKALGYYEYTKNDTVTFFRGTDSDDPAVKYTGTESRGNMTLYAQWEAVVCKITDRLGGDVLYVNGTPAAYGTLKEGFEALNTATFTNKEGTTTIRPTATLYLEMLVPDYTMNEGVVNTKRGTVVLTTAPWSNSDTDGYPYSGEPGTTCTIYRGKCDTSMITNERNLMIRDITLDGRNPIKNMYGNVIGYESVNTVCDGGIVNSKQSSVLTIGINISGSITTLQYSQVEGNGGAVSLAANTTFTLNGGSDCSITGCIATGNGGAIHAGQNSTVTISSGTISHSKAANGGAIYMDKNGTAKIQGGTISDNNAVNGGAIYVDSNGAATVSGGEINGNVAAGDGAGIYLTEDSKLYLFGDPYFGGTGLNDEGEIVYTTGNFSTGAALPADAKNGGKAYTSARQDIYLAGTGTPLSSIQVTGAITSGNGAIWVWAEEPEHYDMLKQFAIFYGNGTELSDDVKETTMKAFRNARPDSRTNCGGDYLTGQKGDDVNGWKCIYWTGGFDVVFKKIDGYGKPLPSATFTLYSDPACTTPFEMTFTGSTPVTGDGKRATTVSSDGTATYKDKNGSIVTLEKGEVLLSKVPPKTFYLKETVVPAKDPEGKDHIYKLDETIYEVKISGTGELEMHKKSSSTATSYDVEVFKVKTSTDPAPEVWQYQVMNVSKAERKVILRKVAEENKTIRSLPGAVFQIERFDGMLIESTDINGNKTTTFTSSASGVYFIDKLPYGVYYLYEKTAPTGYTSGKWFTLTVSNDNANGSRDGVTVAEITDAALLTRLNQSIGNS